MGNQATREKDHNATIELFDLGDRLECSVPNPEEPAEPQAQPRPLYLGGFDPDRRLLDGALKWIGIGLVATSVAPITFVLGVPRFLWHVLPDEVPQRWLSLLAFPLLGVFLLWLRRREWTKGGKGLAAIGAVAFAATIASLAPELTSGLFSGLPAHLWQHAPLYVTAFAILCAAARLAAHSENADWTTPLRWLTAAGSALLLVFYLLPQRGEVPLLETFRSLGHTLSELPARAQIGIWANRIIVLVPIGVLLTSILSVARRRPVAPGVMFAFFAAILPVLCIVTGFRTAMAASGFSLLVNVRNAVILGGTVLVSAAALCAIYTQLLRDPPREDRTPSTLWRDRLLGAVISSVPPGADLPTPTDRSAAALLWRRANPVLRFLARRRYDELLAEQRRFGSSSEPPRDYILRRLGGADPTDVAPAAPLQAWHPPRWALGTASLFAAPALVLSAVGVWFLLSPHWQKGITWRLRPATAASRTLFERHLPSYIVALSRAQRARGSSAKWARARLAKARGALLAQAQQQPALARSLRRFTEEVERSEHRPKSTARRIADIDRASHAAGLPFVVEPLVWTRRVGGEPDARRPWVRKRVDLKPWVALKVFEVQRLRVFESRGERFTAVWVERLDKLNIGEAHLGRSWRQSPYALVLADEARDYVKTALLPALAPDGRLPRYWRIGGQRLQEALGELLRTGLREATRSAASPAAQHEQLAHLIALTTERHELEHESDPRDSVPAPLHRMMAMFTDRAVRRAAAELRGYLAELATPILPSATAMPAVLFARLLRIAAASGIYRAEWFAARLIVRRIAEKMGIATRDGEELNLAEIALKAASKPSRIAKTAAAVFEDLFGAPPERLKLVEERITPRAGLNQLSSAPSSPLGGGG